MKRALISVGGNELPMCFSLRVVNACGEKFGGLEGLEAALTGGGDPLSALNNCVWLLAQMLDAGARHAALNGEQAEPAPSEDDLLDLFGLDDLAALKTSLLNGMAADNARTVEAAPEKNAGAAGGDQQAR